MARKEDREEQPSVADQLSFSINVEYLEEFETRIQHVMSLIDDLNRRAAACEKQVLATITAIDKIGYTVTGPKPASST
jgi:hypothetical protein